ncbi:unnamed protein product [Ectocarpus sp. 4 AP-2014]
MLLLSRDSIHFTADDTTTKATNTRRQKMFSIKGKEKKKVTHTRLFSIREVGIEQPNTEQEGTTLCRVTTKDGKPGFSFSFACKDGAVGVSSSDVTKCAAIVVKKRLNPTPLNDYWHASTGSTEASSDFAGFLKATYLLCSNRSVFGPSGVAVSFNVKREHQEWSVPFEGVINLPLGAETLVFEGGHKKEIYASRVRAIELEEGRNTRYSEGTECVIEMKEDDETTKISGKSLGSNRIAKFRFACKNGDSDLSSSEVTKFAALVIQERFNLVPPQFETGRQAHKTALITQLLQPLDLAAKYLGKFQATGIRFESLGVVTQGVLAEMGITDRVDQINIYGLIQGLFRGPRKCPHSFAELLEPLGLVEKYCEAFCETGVLRENLGFVTREDLAQVVGITDLGDQINILSRIERFCGEYPDYRDRVSGPSTADSRDSTVEAVQAGAEAGEAVMEFVGNMLTG